MDYLLDTNICVYFIRGNSDINYEAINIFCNYVNILPVSNTWHDISYREYQTSWQTSKYKDRKLDGLKKIKAIM